ncbi:MAG: hypothetical protein B0W54_20490 [Cellvibrio sp. 79]|nr:MAG: hypothetical protein B0W54_20490 [Cellvibrio sp. 79]
MVVFAITRAGYLELEPIIKTLKYPVWVGAGVLSNSELTELRHLGLNLTNFSYSIEPNNMETILDALADISAHHPGHRIWLECQPE